MHAPVLERPVVVDDLTRRELIGAGLALGALAACGRREDAGDSGPAGGAAEPTTRTVIGANGPVDVPVRPQRVVALDPVTTEHLAVLGIAAVGALVGGSFERFRSLHPGATNVYGADGLNLEAIVSLRPDLIIGWPLFASDVAGKLPAVAPYVGTVRKGFLDWREDLRFVAGAVGEQGRGDQVLAAYDQRVSRLKGAIATAFRNQNVSILRTKGDGATMTLVADGAFGASIAAGVGLPRPPSGASVPADRTDVERRNGEYNISLEQLGLLDADHLILITRPPGTSPKEEQQLAELRTNPLWSNLRFARTGKVHVVSLDDWLQGSARAAGRVLDDLERIAASA